jgi:hypothetical protein
MMQASTVWSMEWLRELQTLTSSIDSLLLDIFLIILLVIDTLSKDEGFFD